MSTVHISTNQLPVLTLASDAFTWRATISLPGACKSEPTMWELQDLTGLQSRRLRMQSARTNDSGSNSLRAASTSSRSAWQPRWVLLTRRW